MAPYKIVLMFFHLKRFQKTLNKVVSEQSENSWNQMFGMLRKHYGHLKLLALKLVCEAFSLKPLSLTLTFISHYNSEAFACAYELLWHSQSISITDDTRTQ